MAISTALWKLNCDDSDSLHKKLHNPFVRGFRGTNEQSSQTTMVGVHPGADAPQLRRTRGGVHVIRFENVSKTYKNGSPALKDITLDIEKGEFVFLVGASGSGKTTFLRLLLREELPDKGRILEAGRDLTELSKFRVPFLRRNIGCVFQDFRLLPNKTVFENVAFALEVIGRPRSTVESQVPLILDLVGLSDKSKSLPGELSGGEQQRVAVARAFVNRPLILLADEPTGNLDPANSESIMALLERINRTGTTVVMATHDKALVDRMRRRVVELDKGEMIRDQVRGVYGIDESVAI